MLLVNQAGHVRVGEVVRYTLTYTPARDRHLPPPAALHVRIKNTTAIPYRAAYLHGPYALHVATYPATYSPYTKLEDPKANGVPEFEPMLKAGGHFHSTLTVPPDLRLDPRNASPTSANNLGSVTWIIEIASQVLFSKSAIVNYEILVAHDQRSLELGFASIASKGYGGPGQLEQVLRSPSTAEARRKHPQKGVYTEAMDLVVEDTDALWNKPALPTWDDLSSGAEKAQADTKDGAPASAPDALDSATDTRPQKKIHLVVLTHGIHSNVGADMLFMKESIDATVRRAREEAPSRRRQARSNPKPASTNADQKEPSSTAPLSGGQEDLNETAATEDDPEDEQVIVRGFSGNTTKTERGIKFLGKRLAKHVLTMTYPDQPYLPATKTRKLSLGSSKSNKTPSASHPGSTILNVGSDGKERLPYTFSSISFVGHSLGGLVQTYAVAYIQKHAPQFFEQIKPVNFICMASPMLGLSNENPLYVKFALDFGLVGRTGQDLGLTWRAPNIAKTGWASVLSTFGNVAEKHDQDPDPGAKPLLRILPTGPAHQVLKKFRNRTVYSNVVNDGIVPLRTSCLLFLDWRGLDRVENVRRDNGLLATMASVGWAEITGANVISHRPLSADKKEEIYQPKDDKDSAEVATADPPKERAASDTTLDLPTSSRFLAPEPTETATASSQATVSGTSSSNPPASPLQDILSFFRIPAPKSEPSPKATRRVSLKAHRPYRRAQTLRIADMDKKGTSSAPELEGTESDAASAPKKRPLASRGDSLQDAEDQAPPPKTSIFDSAADLLSPPIPPLSWLTDPSSRDRTIFHDRIYHPEDIPPPPVKKAKAKSFSMDQLRRSPSSLSDASTITEPESMKVEEKIARAYHRDMAWRKVLVRLQPDAHNNMIVRRIFANAYGWDVVKHVCDTHFSDSYEARTKDAMESSRERARDPNEPVSEQGGETNDTPQDQAANDLSESVDSVPELSSAHTTMNSSQGGRPGSAVHHVSGDSSRPSTSRKDSVEWDDNIFSGSDSDDDSDDEPGGPLGKLKQFLAASPKDAAKNRPAVDTSGATAAGLSADPHIASFLSSSPVEASASDVLKSTYDVDLPSSDAHGDRAVPGGTAGAAGLHKAPAQSVAGDDQNTASVTERVAQAFSDTLASK